jgi:hypothetical protein
LLIDPLRTYIWSSKSLFSHFFKQSFFAMCLQVVFKTSVEILQKIINFSEES